MNKIRSQEEAMLVLENFRTDCVPLNLQFAQYQRLKQARIKSRRRKITIVPQVLSGITIIGILTNLTGFAYAKESEPLLSPLPPIKQESKILNQENEMDRPVKKKRLKKLEPRLVPQLETIRHRHKRNHLERKKEQNKINSPEIPRSPLIPTEIEQPPVNTVPSPQSTTIQEEKTIKNIAVNKKVVIDQSNKLDTVQMESMFAKASSQKTNKIVEEKQAETNQWYRVKKGDNLWKIAEKIYGDGTEWIRIWEENKKMLIQRDKRNAQDPGHWIYPNQELMIPQK